MEEEKNPHAQIGSYPAILDNVIGLMKLMICAVQNVMCNEPIMSVNLHIHVHV